MGTYMGAEAYPVHWAAIGALPSSQIMLQLDQPVCTLSGVGLGPAGAAALGECLMDNATVMDLQLRDNALDAVGFGHLVTGIQVRCPSPANVLVS